MINEKRRSAIIMALTISAIMLTASLSMCIISHYEEADNEAIGIDYTQPTFDNTRIELDEEEFSLLRSLLLAYGCETSELDRITNEWESDGEITLGALGFVAGLVVGIAIGFSVGLVVGKLISSKSGAPSGNTPQLMAELRYRLASGLYNTYEAALGIFWKLTLNSAEILKFTQSYFDLQTEVYVNNIYAPNTTLSNIDDMLYAAGATKNLSIMKGNINQAINELSYTERKADWTTMAPGGNATDFANTYSGKIGSGWTYGSQQWFGDSTNTYMQLGDYVYASSSNYRVYIDVIYDSSVIANIPNINAMYNTNTTSVTIKNVVTGTTYTLNPGLNNLGPGGLNITPGLYDLAQNTGYISSNLMASKAVNGLTPTVGFVLNNSTGVAYGWKISSGYRILNAGVTYDVSDVSMSVFFDDVDGSRLYLHSSLLGSLEAYGKILEMNNAILNRCIETAFVTWMVLDALEAQQGSYVIRPSSIISGLNINHNLSPASQAMVYLSAMRQLTILGANADPSNIMISKESIEGQIYCYGNIHYMGGVIENAIFTPVIYSEKNKTLRVGGPYTLTDSDTALMIIYATGVSSITEWIPDPDTFGVVELTGARSQIEIFEIWHNGEYVSSVELTVLSAQQIGAINFGFSHRPAVGVAQSKIDFWMGLAIFFAGLSVLLAGLLFKGSPVLLIIGAIIMVLGILQITSGVVTSIIDGFMGFINFLSDPLGGWFK